MSTTEAQRWDGTAEASYDPCYHRECDTIDNVNMEVLVEMAQATEATLNRLLNPEKATSRNTPGAVTPLRVGGCSHEHREAR